MIQFCERENPTVAISAEVFFYSTGRKNVKDGFSSTTAWSFTSMALGEGHFALIKQVSLFCSKWNLKSNCITCLRSLWCKRKACIEWDWSWKAVICKAIKVGFLLFQTDQLLRTASQHSDSSGFAEDSTDCSPFNQLQVRFLSCDWNTPD